MEFSLTKNHLKKDAFCEPVWMRKWTLYGVNVKWEIVPDCRVNEGSRPFSKSLCLQMVCRNYQIRSEDDIRVCIYAVILKNIWNHHKKWQNDTEIRACTESYTILEAKGGNREQLWCDVTFRTEQQAQQHHFVPSGAHQWDFWEHLQAGSYNSPVLRMQKQKQLQSRHTKGADKCKQYDAVLCWQMCRRG